MNSPKERFSFVLFLLAIIIVIISVLYYNISHYGDRRAEEGVKECERVIMQSVINKHPFRFEGGKIYEVEIVQMSKTQRLNIYYKAKAYVPK